MYCDGQGFYGSDVTKIILKKKSDAHSFEQNTVSSAINKLIFCRHFD